MTTLSDDIYRARRALELISASEKEVEWLKLELQRTRDALVVVARAKDVKIARLRALLQEMDANDALITMDWRRRTREALGND